LFIFFQLNNIYLTSYKKNHINIDFKILWIRDADIPFFFSVFDLSLIISRLTIKNINWSHFIEGFKSH
jgi:hypothetical protein